MLIRHRGLDSHLPTRALMVIGAMAFAESGQEPVRVHRGEQAFASHRLLHRSCCVLECRSAAPASRREVVRCLPSELKVDPGEREEH
jgi:hypothetical protein